jgi:tetratricopeptide (TPR) repeat protein
MLTAQVEAYVIAPNVEGSEELLVEIQQSIQSGDFQNARTEIQNAFKTLPDDPRLYNFLGVVDAQQQNFDKAAINFQRAIKIAPRFTGAYMNLGRLYQEASVKDPRYNEKALNVYNRVSAMEPGNTEARYQAALLLNRLGRPDASLRQLSQIPGQEQHRAAALSLRCADEAALQHKALAKASAMELLKAPDLTEADILPIVEVLVRNHQSGLATMLLESLVKRNAASATLMEQLATLYEAEQRLGDARQMLTRELESEGQPSPVLLRHLAKLAYKAGDLEQALGYLAHARDLEPENAATHFLFGLVCIDLKLPPEAEESLKQAVRLDPQNSYYNYALGAVQLERHNPDGAIQHFKTFRNLNQQDPRGSFALGVAYFDADQSEAARAALESAAGDAQTRPGALLYLGRLALREQNLAEASDDLERAIQANPAIPQAYVELAVVQIRAKKYQAAEQNLDRALRLAPDNYQANFDLLVLYKQTRDTRAEEQSRRVTALREATDEREKMLLRSLDIHPY